MHPQKLFIQKWSKVDSKLDIWMIWPQIEIIECRFTFADSKSTHKDKQLKIEALDRQTQPNRHSITAVVSIYVHAFAASGALQNQNDVCACCGLRAFVAAIWGTCFAGGPLADWIDNYFFNANHARSRLSLTIPPKTEPLLIKDCQIPNDDILDIWESGAAHKKIWEKHSKNPPSMIHYANRFRFEIRKTIDGLHHLRIAP